MKSKPSLWLTFKITFQSSTFNSKKAAIVLWKLSGNKTSHLGNNESLAIMVFLQLIPSKNDKSDTLDKENKAGEGSREARQPKPSKSQTSAFRAPPCESPLRHQAVRSASRRGAPTVGSNKRPPATSVSQQRCSRGTQAWRTATLPAGSEVKGKLYSSHPKLSPVYFLKVETGLRC